MPHAVILMRSGMGPSAGVLLKSQCPLCGLQSRGPREPRPLHNSTPLYHYARCLHLKAIGDIPIIANMH